MIDVIGRAVSAKAPQFGWWALFAFLAVYFIYKEWPEFKKRVSKSAVKEREDQATSESVAGRLGSIETEVSQINEKLDRDYKRLNKMEMQIETTRSAQADASEELTIIIEALLGALGGLQELGANGPTKKAEERIQGYLNRKAHSSKQIEPD